MLESKGYRLLIKLGVEKMLERRIRSLERKLKTMDGGMKEERKELKEMGRESNNMSDRLYWYVARDNLGLEMPDGAEERLSFNHLGYISKPSGEIIKKYDLELVGRLTRSELFDKYF